MARLVLSLAGAAAGGFFFPGSQFAMSAGFAIGGFVSNLLFPQKLPDVVGPRIDDLRIQSSAYGRPIPILYATLRLPGNVIWSTGLIEEKKTERIGGGKGGLSGKGGGTSTTFEYFASWSSAICEGPADITRIWADTKLIYDATAANQAPTGRFIANIRIYRGDETQVADAIIEADKGAGQVPGNRGLCHIVFDRFPLADWGNRIPNITAEVSKVATEAFPQRTLATLPGTQLPGFWMWNPTRTKLWITHATVWDGAGTDLILTRMDPVTLNIIRQSDLILRPVDPNSRVETLGYTIDADDNIYFILSELGGPANWWVRKIDGITFTELWTTTVLPTPPVGLLAGNVVLADGSVVTLAIYGSESNNIIIFSPGGGFKILTNGVDFAVTGPDRDYPDHAIDNEGNAWYVGLELFSDGGDLSKLHLLRVSPGGGTLEIVLDEGGGILNFIGDVLFDTALNRLLITIKSDAGGGQKRLSMLRFDPVNFVVDGRIDEIIVASSPSGAWSEMATSSFKPGSTHFVISVGASFAEIDPSALTVVRLLGGWTQGGSNWIYNEVNHSFLRSGGHEWFIDRQERSTETLRAVVEDILRRVGYSASDYDMADFDFDSSEEFNAPLWDDVLGYALTTRAPARKFIAELASVYLFHVVETDWILKGIRRQNNSASATTLALADMAVREFGADAVADFDETRRQEAELPVRVDLVYLDRDRDYQEGSQHAKRISEAVRTEDTVTVRVPIVFDATNAKQRAEIMLFQAWVARIGFNLALSPKHLELDPGDFIEFPIEGVNRRSFLTNIDYGASGLILCQAILDDVETLTSDAVGTDATIPSNISLLVPPPPTELFLMDVTLFRDRDDDAGFYLAAGGPDGWRGALISRSTDGNTFDIFAAVLSGQEAIAGFAQTALPDGPATVFDTVNSVDIVLFDPDFTLETKTRIEVLNGANAAVLGDEIIQWRTASVNSDGSFTLSDLLRGRRGSEHATSGHVAGERFVALSSATVQRIAQDIGQRGLERSYRASSIGEDPERAVTVRFTNTATGLKPLSPVHITGFRDSLDDIDIAWFRRARTGKAHLANAGLPLGEDAEAYEIDILDGGAVVRTLTGLTTTSANYSASQQIADFGSVQASVAIEIFQTSAQVGRGFPGAATV